MDYLAVHPEQLADVSVKLAGLTEQLAGLSARLAAHPEQLVDDSAWLAGLPEYLAGHPASLAGEKALPGWQLSIPDRLLSTYSI